MPKHGSSFVLPKKNNVMKQPQQGNRAAKQNDQAFQGQRKNQRPEIRDNLDSRKNEEQDFKGDDVTHNEKPTKEKHLKEKG